MEVFIEKGSDREWRGGRKKKARMKRKGTSIYFRMSSQKLQKQRKNFKLLLSKYLIHNSIVNKTKIYSF